ncbi:phosphopantetheine adenylyltransferase [Noviherbaspirillum sp.]|uniref:phosphopantetheine adenylyltransferase n=1 Tax=Noviherbaspirillum sp. TaxID=1926288 RepID=UPI002FE2A96B
MNTVVKALLVIVGVIHLLPLAGVAGAEKLAALYGIQVADPNLAILMRHRAVLFGLLGIFICYAAFIPRLQLLSLIGGLISVVSFLWLAWATGGYNPLVGRVVVADMVALACLLVAGMMYALNRPPAGSR